MVLETVTLPTLALEPNGLVSQLPWSRADAGLQFYLDYESEKSNRPMLEYLEKVDIKLFYLINKDGQNTLFDYMMPIVSNFNYFIVPLILWGLFCFDENRGWCWAVLVVAFSDWLCYFVLKPLFGRPRPFDMLSASIFTRRVGL